MVRRKANLRGCILKRGRRYVPMAMLGIYACGLLYQMLVDSTLVYIEDRQVETGSVYREVAPKHLI